MNLELSIFVKPEEDEDGTFAFPFLFIEPLIVYAEISILRISLPATCVCRIWSFCSYAIPDFDLWCPLNPLPNLDFILEKILSSPTGICVLDCNGNGEACEAGVIFSGCVSTVNDGLEYWLVVDEGGGGGGAFFLPDVIDVWLENTLIVSESSKLVCLYDGVSDGGAGGAVGGREGAGGARAGGVGGTLDCAVTPGTLKPGGGAGGADGGVGTGMDGAAYGNDGGAGGAGGIPLGNEGGTPIGNDGGFGAEDEGIWVIEFFDLCDRFIISSSSGLPLGTGADGELGGFGADAIALSCSDGALIPFEAFFETSFSSIT